MLPPRLVPNFDELRTFLSSAIEHRILDSGRTSPASPRARMMTEPGTARSTESTWRRTYALAGRALEELGRTGPAMRAYQTAIALSEGAPNDSRDILRLKVKRLRAERDDPDR